MYKLDQKKKPDSFSTTNPQKLCSLPTSLAIKSAVQQRDDFMTPIRHTCTLCQPTGLLDRQRTHATSDGRACREMGKVSARFQLLTEREQHLESPKLCWLTVRWRGQRFNRMINWLCSSAWHPGDTHTITVKNKIPHKPKRRFKVPAHSSQCPLKQNVSVDIKICGH